MFSYFEELASARQVMLRLLEQQRKLPRRSSSDRQLRWVPATYRAIHDILTNPVFAGAYAYGRKRTERRVENGVVRERQRRAPREEWHVCSGTCASRTTTPATSRSSATSAIRSSCGRTGARRAGRGGGAAREGKALLQGLIRCGRSGT